MKQTLVIFLFLFAAVLNAQTNNYAQHNAVRKTYNIVSINNKSYYIVSEQAVGSCCLETAKLIAHNTIGTKMFEIACGQMGLIRAAQIAVMANKTLLLQISSQMHQCDTGGPLTLLCNYDTLGNLLWSKTYAKNMGQALCKNDGSFLILRSDSLLHYNSNGQLISKFLINGGVSQTGACLLASGNIAYTKFTGSSYQVDRIDTAGNLITSQPTQTALVDMVELPSTAIIATSGGRIIKLSATLQPIASSSVSMPQINYRASCFKNDSIYALGLSSTGLIRYTRFDTNFNVFYSSTSNLEGAIPSGICTGNDQNLRFITTASSEQSFTDTHTFSSFSQFKNTGNFNATKDVGVLDAQVLGYLVSYNSPPGQIMISYSVQATVKNYGTDTVRYFKLNLFAKFVSISYCLLGLHQDFAITVPPGGTVAVNTKAFTTSPLPMSVLQSSNVVTGQFCFYTSVPDSSIDYEISNNTACKSFTFSLLHTAIEEGLMGNKISVFPNPVTAQLQIKSEEQISAIKIYNALGAEVFVSTHETKNASVDCSGFAPGVYSISVKIGEAWLRKKIVVE